MSSIFSFHKKKEDSFEIKNDNLKNVELHDFITEGLSKTEVHQIGYEDERWIEKSKTIKARDNYTCQLCNAFNPQIGDFVFIKQGDYETVHRYFWAGSSKYEITVKGYILIITFDFMPGYHLAMPRLNVHHKIYYKNRNLWDYDQDSLVTLCESCHHYVHSLNDIGIPIAEETMNGQPKLLGVTSPKPYHPKLDHTDLGTFRPLALVKENFWGDGLQGQDLLDFRKAKNSKKQWYDYCKILDEQVVQINYFTAENEFLSKHTREETIKVANFIIEDFIKNFLGFSYR